MSPVSWCTSPSSPTRGTAGALRLRDTTRVAAGDPNLWTGILLHNREAILQALAALDGALAGFRDALANGDRAALDALLTQGKRGRDALGS